MLKRVALTVLAVFALLVFVLGIHIYIMTRPKAPDATTRGMARIDIKQPITSQDAGKITGWLYAQKGVDRMVPTKAQLSAAGCPAMTPDPANSGAMIEKGRLGIRSVVDSAIFVIADDSKINSYFMTLLTEVGSSNFTGFNALSKNLTDFI